MALLDLLRLILQMVSDNAAAGDNREWNCCHKMTSMRAFIDAGCFLHFILAVGAILACCAACCVGVIANLVEYFNRYAYIEIGE